MEESSASMRLDTDIPTTAAIPSGGVLRAALYREYDAYLANPHEFDESRTRLLVLGLMICLEGGYT